MGVNGNDECRSFWDAFCPWVKGEGEVGLFIRDNLGIQVTVSQVSSLL